MLRRAETRKRDEIKINTYFLTTALSAADLRVKYCAAARTVDQKTNPRSVANPTVRSLSGNIDQLFQCIFLFVGGNEMSRNKKKKYPIYTFICID